LLIVLESLSPPERLAFVLHDVFAVSFDEIAKIMDRSPAAARQLASRARRRVQAARNPTPTWRCNGGWSTPSWPPLAPVTSPRCCGCWPPTWCCALTSARTAARRCPERPRLPGNVLKAAPRFISFATPVLVNGAVGALFGTREDPISVLGFTIVGGRIAALDLVATPAKLRHLRIDS
jgi:Sigma-70, region 4